MFNSMLDEVFIIAEVGINHDGQLNKAKKLILAAKNSGANSVKVQVRHLESVYTKQVLSDPLKAEHGTQYLLHELKKAHLTFDDIKVLKKYSEEIGIIFFATPFDIHSAEFLNEIGCELFKVGSPDFSNLPLIKKIASFKKPILLSTGMSMEPEIIQVVSFLKEENSEFALLHCNSTYPASFQDINLNYMPKLQELSNVIVGYSGHERGFAPTLAAVAKGARIIERHITEDFEGSGPDHSASLDIDEFAQMVKSVREIEDALGISEKVCNQGEQNNRLALGKSLVYAHKISSGEILSEKDIISKSPAKGLSPLELNDFIGKKINRDVKEDEYIFHDHVEQSKKIEPKSNFKIEKTWGIVGRLNDFEDYLDMKPDLVEIHLTWRDLVEFDLKKFKPSGERFSQDLVVHAPEYFHDELIDFTSSDSRIEEMSLDMLNRTFELARSVAPFFEGVDSEKGPRVVVHPGGHFKSKPKLTDKGTQYSLLKKNLSSIDSRDVRVLVENMPPFPWYFGGQWYNTVFLDPGEIAQFAEELNWGVCYDLSHAQLYCNYKNLDLKNFTKEILDHVHYLHISDGLGTTQEGLQLGHGNLDFEHLFEILSQLDVGFIPEIWQGHLNKGEGFKKALEIIEDLLVKKMSGTSCSKNHGHHPGQ